MAPLAITAGGKFADNKLDFDTTVGSNDGLSLKAAGNVALADPKAPVLMSTPIYSTCLPASPMVSFPISPPKARLQEK